MSELRLFAQSQDKAVIKSGKGASATTQPADGRITHFCGNVHETIGDPNVDYGVTNWPDLSCSFILQVEKLCKWTGDKRFAVEMYPHVKRPLAWLESADSDGDLIPEGGSTYDYEKSAGGTFSYTASCYLGALRAGMEIAREQGDREMEGHYRERFAAVQASVMKSLWNGSYFIKNNDPKTGKQNRNSFIAALAGRLALTPFRLRANARSEDLARRDPVAHRSTRQALLSGHADGSAARGEAGDGGVLHHPARTVCWMRSDLRRIARRRAGSPSPRLRPRLDAESQPLARIAAIPLARRGAAGAGQLHDLPGELACARRGSPA